MKKSGSILTVNCWTPWSYFRMEKYGSGMVRFLIFMWHSCPRLQQASWPESWLFWDWCSPLTNIPLNLMVLDGIKEVCTIGNHFRSDLEHVLPRKAHVEIHVSEPGFSNMASDWLATILTFNCHILHWYCCPIQLLSHLIYGDLCARSRYQGQGQVITSHNICGM